MLSSFFAHGYLEEPRDSRYREADTHGSGRHPMCNAVTKLTASNRVNIEQLPMQAAGRDMAYVAFPVW